MPDDPNLEDASPPAEQLGLFGDGAGLFGEAEASAPAPSAHSKPSPAKEEPPAAEKKPRRKRAKRDEPPESGRGDDGLEAATQESAGVKQEAANVGAGIIAVSSPQSALRTPQFPVPQPPSSSPRRQTPGRKPSSGVPYRVFALKYRPRRFCDLIGQERIAATLSNGLETGRVAHAFLFTGSRGVGKTTSARILAKALNCEAPERAAAQPCCACDICLAIERGDDLDVIEIDGASNNGVDQVRDLRDRVALRPARARYKVYIIDEVHMLTAAAFNALLKTLEEPPDHVKFIFATTEPHKVLDTIISRCQRYDFQRITASDIERHLAEICAQESVSAEPAALRLIAHAAQGGMRDAQSMLDRVVSFHARVDGGCDLHVHEVADALGLIGPETVQSLFLALARGDGAAAVALVEQLEREGRDLWQFAQDLLRLTQQVLRARLMGGAPEDRFDEPEDTRRWLEAQSRVLSEDTLLLWGDFLMHALPRLRDAESARAVLDLTLLRLARAGDLLSVPELIERLTRLEARLDGASPPPRSASPPPSPGSAPPRGDVTPPAGDAQRPRPASGADDARSGPSQPAPPRPDAAPAGHAGAPPAPDQDADALWQAMREAITDGMVSHYAQDAQALDLRQGVLRIGVKESLPRITRVVLTDVADTLGQVASRAAGRAIQVEVVSVPATAPAPARLPSGQDAHSALDGQPPPQADDAPTPDDSDAPPAPSRGRACPVRSSPVFQAAQQIFGGVDEDAGEG